MDDAPGAGGRQRERDVLERAARVLHSPQRRFAGAPPRRARGVGRRRERQIAEVIFDDRDNGRRDPVGRVVLGQADGDRRGSRVVVRFGPDDVGLVELAGVLRRSVVAQGPRPAAVPLVPPPDLVGPI